MEEKKDFYTELRYRCKAPDEWGPREVTIKDTAWDLDASEMLEMFRGIMLGATYYEDTFMKTLIAYLEEHGYDVIKREESHDEVE